MVPSPYSFCLKKVPNTCVTVTFSLFRETELQVGQSSHICRLKSSFHFKSCVSASALYLPVVQLRCFGHSLRTSASKLSREALLPGMRRVSWGFLLETNARGAERTARNRQLFWEKPTSRGRCQGNGDHTHAYKRNPQEAQWPGCCTLSRQTGCVGHQPGCGTAGWQLCAEGQARKALTLGWLDLGTTVFA